MKKYFLLLFFVILAHIVIAQENKVYWSELLRKQTSSEKWIDEINKFLQPHFVLLKDNYCHSFYKEFKIPTISNDFVVAIANDTVCEDGNGICNKLFVFTVNNFHLSLIDTMCVYQADGRGPKISVEGNFLIFNQGYHRENVCITYKLDKVRRKFILANYEIIDHQSANKKKWKNRNWQLNQELDFKNKQVIFKSGLISKKTLEPEFSKRLVKTKTSFVK